MPGEARFGPTTRRASLTVHVVSSVGWLGSVLAFLALAVVGWTTGDVVTARAMYVGMDVVTRWVILPLCGASVVSGCVQSLGTHWGLVRHYWVVAKLVLTVLATLVLFVHTQPIADLAEVARTATVHDGLLPSHARPLQLQLFIDAAAAVGVLLVTTALSVIKPAGVTPYGWRLQQGRESAA